MTRFQLYRLKVICQKRHNFGKTQWIFKSYLKYCLNVMIWYCTVLRILTKHTAVGLERREAQVNSFLFLLTVSISNGEWVCLTQFWNRTTHGPSLPSLLSFCPVVSEKIHKWKSCHTTDRIKMPSDSKS